jgi:hypothetical protein
VRAGVRTLSPPNPDIFTAIPKDPGIIQRIHYTSSQSKKQRCLHSMAMDPLKLKEDYVEWAEAALRALVMRFHPGGPRQAPDSLRRGRFGILETKTGRWLIRRYFPLKLRLEPSRAGRRLAPRSCSSAAGPGFLVRSVTQNELDGVSILSETILGCDHNRGRARDCQGRYDHQASVIGRRCRNIRQFRACGNRKGGRSAVKSRYGLAFDA